MTLSTRTLVALAIAASATSGVLYGAPNAAYAAHVDGGRTLLHGHHAGAPRSPSHARPQVPAHLRCILCAWREPVLP
jgi:hypothetical protein